MMSLCVVSCFCISNPELSFAYTQLRTQSGAGIRFSPGDTYVLAGSPVNRSGLSPQSIAESVLRALSKWTSGAQGAVGFDYWQGVVSSFYESNSNYNGQSSLYFTSNSTQKLGPGVLGMTQVWYDPGSGQILESDIALNDDDFTFTMNPQDSTGFGVFPDPSFGNRVYLENVLTHEMGHAFGLSHSGEPESTMLFQEAPEQVHLSCDDQVGIRSVYADASTGISGTLTKPNGAPLFGGEVVAISQARGEILASTVTDSAGNYRFSGLEPGLYYMMARPYAAPIESLPGVFAGGSSAICSGSYFERTFAITPVEVRSGQIASGPTIAADCGGTDRFALMSMVSAMGVVTVGSRGEFAAQDTLDGGGYASFSFADLSGPFEVHLLAFALGVSRDVQVVLKRSGGEVVVQAGMTVAQDVYLGESGRKNFDSTLFVPNLEFGDYVLEVYSSSVSSNWFGLGSVSVENTPAVMIVGQKGASQGTAIFPDVSRCRMQVSIAGLSAKSGIPPRRDGAGTSEDDRDGGGCGNIEIINGSSNRNGRNPSGAAQDSVGQDLRNALSWGWPFILLGLLKMGWSQRGRLRHKFALASFFEFR